MVEDIRHPDLLEALSAQANHPTFLDAEEDPDVVQVTHERFLQLAELAATGELVSGAAHEIKNPLAIVIGYCELLLRTEEDRTTKERLQIVFDQAQRACRMVDALVSFGIQRTAAKSLLDVRDCLERVLRLRSYKLSANNIEVVREFSGTLPMILADDHHLSQVFLNLVTNSEHAMSTTGSGGRLMVAASVNGGHIRVTVQADGPGVAPEHVSKIFSPFFTTKPVGKGAGLGLNICTSIVERHGGRIWLGRPPGQGAAFHVDLPVISEPSRETTSTTVLQGWGPGRSPTRYLCLVSPESEPRGEAGPTP